MDMIQTALNKWNDAIQMITETQKIQVVKRDENAFIPSKAHSDDIGYDLTIISHAGALTERVALYDTGIVVKPPRGFYIEILPRSSFGKSGYMLANSVGVIDPQYRGTLKVAIARVDDNAPPLKLPLKGFQIVLRRAESSVIEQVEPSQEFLNTVRGEGGFGSTGN